MKMISISLFGYNLDAEYISTELPLIDTLFRTTQLRRVKHCAIYGKIKTNTKDLTLHGAQYHLYEFLSNNSDSLEKIRNKYEDIKIQTLLLYTNYSRKDGSQVYTCIDPRLIKILAKLDILFLLQSVNNVALDDIEYVQYIPRVLSSKFNYNIKDKESDSDLFVDISKYNFIYLKEICRRWIELNNKIGHEHHYLCLSGNHSTLILDCHVNEIYLYNKTTSQYILIANLNLFTAYRMIIKFINNESIPFEENIRRLQINTNRVKKLFPKIIAQTKRSIITEEIRKNNLSALKIP